MKRFLPFASPILVILLCVFAILPLMHAGFFPMHDDEQVARLFDLNQAIMSGNIPPRIAPNLGFGYGYPFFNFYPPFAYYVGEVFHLLGFGYIVSTKLMIATGFVLAALFMYLFTEKLFGKVAGVVAAVSYTYVSYHAIDVYVRGAFAEFFAFVFLPLIFLCVYKLSQKRSWWVVVIGIFAVAAFILSHNLIAFMSAPFIGIWILYLLIKTQDKVNFINNSVIMFLLGFGVSAYFWLPSYVERNYTLIKILTTELANYSIHFVCVHQLWDSPWGYGGSIPGCYDGLSFEVGKLQIVLAVVSVVLGLLFWRIKKMRAQIVPVFIFFALFIFSLFLMVKFAKPLWDVLPPLWYVQFPWRFLLISSFLVSVLSGAVLFFIKNEKVKLVVGAVLVVLLILQAYPRFTPERYFNATDNHYVAIQTIRWDTSSLAYEYVPQGIATKKSKEGTTQVNITKSEIATSPATVVSGIMQVETIKNLPQEKTFNVRVTSPGVLRINTYSFPGWSITVNGVEYSYTDNNKLKLIDVHLQSGNAVVVAEFKNTSIRSIGNLISVISIIAVLGLVFLALRKNRHHA